MKTFISLTIAVIFFAGNVLFAQQSEKEIKKSISSKTLKIAKKDAKKYKKQGYDVAPGALPLEKQLERSYIKQYETNDEGSLKYLVVTGNSVAETKTAAKLQATETAKMTLAGQINTRVATIVENSLANKQLNNEEAASITKTVAANKNLIAEELGLVIPLVEMYREIGKNAQCDITLLYNMETAFDVVKKVIRENLEDETKALQNKLDSIFQLNK